MSGPNVKLRSADNSTAWKEAFAKACRIFSELGILECISDLVNVWTT